MKTLTTLLKANRQQLDLKIKDIAVMTGIDQALLSKYENGGRLPTEGQLAAISTAYQLNISELQVIWLAEKVLKVVSPYQQVASEVLFVAESRVEYLRSPKAFEVPEVPIKLREQLMKIDRLRSEWLNKKPLSSTQIDKIRQFFSIEYTFESNRIEGNTLSLHETSMVVNEGLTIGGKTMVEHLEAINHSEAVDFVMELATNREDLSRRTLLDLHALILKSIDRDNAGRFRQVPVRISGSRHEPPQPFMLEKLMEDYFVHYRQQRAAMHPVILAAEIHERLVSIHPFIDGNGRASRLAMNLILLRNGYTIANLKGDPASRLAYFQALEKVQVDNAPEAFYKLVADAAEQSLRAHLALV